MADKNKTNPWAALLNGVLNQTIGAAGAAGIGSIMSLFGPNTTVGSIGRAITGSGLTGAQNEQNAFNASQAEITRMWQEKMQGSQYQRSVKDMLAAGLNPALMYGSSAGPASMPTGANASGNNVSPDVSSLINLMMARKNMDLIDSQIIKNEADANKADKEAEGQEITNSWSDQLFEAQLGIYNANYDEIKAKTDLLLEQVKTEATKRGLNNAGINESNARVALLAQQKIAEEIQNKYRDQMLQLDIKYKQLNNDLVAASTNKNDAEVKKLTEELNLVKAQVANIEQNTILTMLNQGLISQETENAAMDWAIKNEKLTQEQVKTKYAGKQARADLICQYIHAATEIVDSAAGVIDAAKPGVTVTKTEYDYKGGHVVGTTSTSTKK